jgi:hypothetical protein
VADLKEKAYSLLSRSTAQSLAAGSKVTLYTVPSGKSCIVTSVIIHDASLTLQAATAVAFGGNATDANDWTGGTTITLIKHTAATMVSTIRAQDYTATTLQPFYLTDTAFGYKVTTGTSNGATCTIDVFGYLY